MTTQMLTLTDFLLARIAEDEERARGAASVVGADEMLAALPTPLFDGLRVGFPTRVLAECEAKRRIVEMVPDLLGVLGALALPYAGHPDYREEWKP